MIFAPTMPSLLQRVFGRSRTDESAGRDAAWESPPPTAAVPAGVRVYAVGDVHGRADLLARMLARIDADREARAGADRSVEVFLGDYIDRGPQSREVIDMLIEREQAGGAICLLGNHEDMLLRALESPALMGDWLNNGGRETLMAYGVAPSPVKGVYALHAELLEALPASHRAFLEGLRQSFECGDYFFVHAGVDPEVPLDQQRTEDLLWIRSRFLEYTGPLSKVIVHGHTPRTQPEIGGYRINIDTGAYITGTLTCLVLEGEDLRFL